MTEAEFCQTALASYRNIQCHSVAEFNDDLNRISLIRKFITHYQNTGELSHRLILNYIIICSNVFGDSAVKLIMYKVSESQYPVLFPFLLFLNRLSIEDSNKYVVTLDQNIIDKLGEL
jgi:hypothetical protein